MVNSQLLKRGIHKKVVVRKSLGNVVKSKLRGVQEKIGQLKERKPTDRFFRDESLRPRLRKSMILRSAENTEDNMIKYSSTPHHTKKSSEPQFFEDNLTVLSPISLGRQSNSGKGQLINDTKNREADEQKATLQNDSDDSSSEIQSPKNYNHCKQKSPEKQSSSIIYMGTENCQDEQRNNLCIRKSKKDQATNRSKIAKECNEIKKEPRNLRSNQSFASHDKSYIKEPNKVSDEVLEQVPANQPVIKKSRIPIRTASQEKIVCCLDKEKIIPRSISESPRNRNSFKSPANKDIECKTPRSERLAAREKRRSNSFPAKDSYQRSKKGYISFEKDSDVDLNPLNKSYGTHSSKYLLDRLENAVEKDKSQCSEGPCRTPIKRLTNRKEIDIDNIQDIANTSVVSPKSSKNTFKEGEKSHLKNYSHKNNAQDNHPKSASGLVGDTFKKDAKKLNSTNKNNNISDNNASRLVELSNDQSVHDRTEFVNKTPRRRTNETCSKQELHIPVSNEIYIPLISVEAASQHENLDLCNKSRPSDVRCKPAERNDGISAVFTKSIGLSPIIGQNKLPETDTLHTTRWEKSVADKVASVHFAVEESLNTSKRCLSPTSPKNVLNGSVATTSVTSKLVFEQQNNNVDKGVADTGTNAFDKLIAEISARRSLLSNRPRTTVNREIQTSMNNTSRGSYGLHRKKGRSWFPRVTEQMTQTSISQSKMTCDRDEAQSCSRASEISSSGAGSDFVESAYMPTMHSEIMHNIFESLEEGNGYDEYDFSKSAEPELSTLDKPWRFVNEGLVLEKPESANLTFIPKESQINLRNSVRSLRSAVSRIQNSLGYSSDSSEDSVHSSASPKNKTIRLSNTLVGTNSNSKCLSKRHDLNPDIPLSRTGRRQYNRKDNRIEELSHPPSEAGSTNQTPVEKTVVSRTSKRSKKDKKSSSETPRAVNSGNTNVEDQNIQQIMTSERTPAEKTFISKASKRFNRINENLFGVSSSSENKRQKSSQDQDHPSDMLSPPNRIPIKKSCQSKNSKKSGKDKRRPSLDKTSSSSNNNPIMSISSADERLLGVKLLDNIATRDDEPVNIELEHISTDVNKSVSSSPAKDSSVSLGKKQNTASQPDHDIPKVRKEKAPNIKQSKRKVAERNLEKSNKENEQQENSNDAGDKVERNIVQSSSTSVKQKGSKRSNSGINEDNILQIVDGGRSQRNRRPVRYKTDLDLEGYILIDDKKALRGIVHRSDSPVNNRTKRTKKSDSGTKKRESQKKGKNKLKTLKKGTTTVEPNVPLNDEENLTENNNNQNELYNASNTVESIEGRTTPPAFELPVISEEIAQVPNVTNESRLNTQSDETQAGQSHKENKSMPPPGDNTTKNLTGRIRIRKNLTVDSGFDTMNKTNNKTTKTDTIRKTRDRTKKTSESDQIESVEANVDHASEEFRAPESELLLQLERVDRIENPCSPAERSLTNIRTGCVTRSHRKHNAAKDTVNKVSRVLERTSESFRNLEQSTAFSEQTNGLSVNGSRSRISFSTNSAYMNIMSGGEVYSLKYLNNLPLDTEYKKYGNLEVNETLKDPEDNFSAGYVRLQPGVQKRPTITKKYSFIYTVISGCAQVQCHNRTGKAEQGGFFMIPKGTEYTIENINSQSELIMTYTKIKGAVPLEIN